MLPIDPDDLIVASVREGPALRRAAIPSTPLSAILLLLHPPVPDIDITAARLTPNRVRAREVHPERPIIVPSQERIANEGSTDFFTRQHAPGDAVA
jgi:hypothetical protein